MSEVQSKIAAKIKSKPAVIFMKGTPSFPMCGFSARAVEALRAVDADFDYVNILEDEAMWEGLKAFTKWPTSPQVFVNGEFIGGCDITLEMYESGDLEKKIKSASAG